MTLSKIEKCARLMGIETHGVMPDGTSIIDDIELCCRRPFNPYLFKGDLIDVENELSIDIDWRNTHNAVFAKHSSDFRDWREEKISSHPDKFTARAHAVMAVVEKIYDRREG